MVRPGHRSRLHDHRPLRGVGGRRHRGTGRRAGHGGRAGAALPSDGPGASRVFPSSSYAGAGLLLGLGAGSTRQDFDAFGRDYARRFSSFDRVVEALREIFADGGRDNHSLSPWSFGGRRSPAAAGAVGGRGRKTAARAFDGWIASAHYRSVDEVTDAMTRFRGAGGGRAIVSTIQVGSETDLGELRDKLRRFAEAGFDDAVVMILPDGPSPAAVRALVEA